MERANLYPDADQSLAGIDVQEKKRLTAQPPPRAPMEPADRSHPISQQKLINTLNYLNFLDKHLTVNFRQKQYGRRLAIKAKPNPCQDNRLICRWQQDACGVVDHPEWYTLENIIVPDGRRFLVATPTVLQIDAGAIHLILPDTCKSVDVRIARRHACRDINIYATQNGALFYGTMIDFSAFAFRVKLKTLPPQTFDWIDRDAPVNVILFDGNRTLYSGECMIIKQAHGHASQAWVLSPVRHHIRRFAPKSFRSTRQKMIPLPAITFIHPLSKKRAHLEVLNLSGSGLAVLEATKNALLLPGLIIPDLQICFGDGTHVACAAQVVYREETDESADEALHRCGLAILDMPADEHVKLLSLIHQTSDQHAYLCGQVNLDDLWNFFFETGFIYPQKYEFIEKNKQHIKATYEKLYTQNPTIARHFIHQRNGRILGHMAMVRFYERAWLIHHHAALRVSNNRGGLAVLNQIGSFINDSHRLNSIKMSYVFCYFRPDNKFPNHVFGGAEKNIGDRQACSIDRFVYFHLHGTTPRDGNLLAEWTCTPATDSDLNDLACHYAEQSGGLMIQAHDLSATANSIEDTKTAFQAIGLVRDRHLYAVKMAGELKAIIVINIADIGLNMSDLTNAAKVILLKPEGLTYRIIRHCLMMLFDRFHIEAMPVLVYPAPMAASLGIPHEKTYHLWILSMKHTDSYFRYLKRLLKFIKH